MPKPQLLGAGQRLPRYLTQIEVRAFFSAIRPLRDRTLFALIYHYGLRVGEVALLTRGDIDLERGRIVVKRLKGGAWTEQPLFRTTAQLLKRYLRGLDLPAEAPLFAGRRGPLRKRQIQSLFVRYRDIAHLSQRYTCHGLRHSIATHLLDAGVSLEFVQDHLGHQSIRSTSIYARITDRHRAALSLAFSGEVTMHRKHTANVFRDLPDLIYRMLSQVSSMRERTDAEIAAMKGRDITDASAHHLMVEAVKASVVPASRLPKVIEAWEEPQHEEFTPRTVWSLFNAFTEVSKEVSPRNQMEGSLRLSSLFRSGLVD